MFRKTKKPDHILLCFYFSGKHLVFTIICFSVFIFVTIKFETKFTDKRVFEPLPGTKKHRKSAPRRASFGVKKREGLKSSRYLKLNKKRILAL